jgi:hypothetical protein
VIFLEIFKPEYLAHRLFIGGLLVFLVAFLYVNHRRRYYRIPKKQHKRISDTTLIRVEDIIQTYSRNGSIPKTALSTGYTVREVKSILINAGKYTTKEEAQRIRNKYK